MTDEQRLKGLIGLLRATVRTATEATMTGAFSKGRNALARTYNAVHAELERAGLVPEGLIPPADDESTIDDIGVLSRNLEFFVEAAGGIEHTRAGAGLSRLSGLGEFAEVFETDDEDREA